MIQKHGTAMVGKLFAPIMLTWFLILAGLGLRSIIANPEVLHALNPMWAVHFFLEYKTVSFIALGAVVLSITGVEALYADMGHFGKFPIRLAWFTVVLPSLTLNYFGQGALLLKNPEAIKNPFFLLAPDWALIPLLIIAALATVIASQAVISGVFSLTRQAVRLGYLSPMRIIHTSEMESGQIYIPFVNWMLYVAVVIVIVSFEHSSNLAAAYGIAVTGTMVLTSILSTTVARQNWHWNKYFVALILIAFLCVDIPLFTANLDKLLSGGWLPLSLGTVMFIVMTTWKSERFRLLRRMHEHGNSLEAMIASLEKSPPVRVPVLELGLEWLDGFHEVLIYPAPFVVDDEWEDDIGLVHNQRIVQSGQSWQQGPIVLNWLDIQDSFDASGFNLIIHEVAHKLDTRNGDRASGVPFISLREVAGWEHDLHAAMNNIQEEIELVGENAASIDAYAASDPAECFAVLSEYFFSAPELFAPRFPSLWQRFCQFYQQDPLQRLHHANDTDSFSATNVH